MRVISEKQREASRQNGSKSKGRPPGSRKESAIVAHTVCLENEPRGAFRAVLESYLDAFQPTTPMERNLIEDLAADYWRGRRLWAVHTSMAKLRPLGNRPSP